MPCSAKQAPGRSVRAPVARAGRPSRAASPRVCYFFFFVAFRFGLRAAALDFALDFVVFFLGAASFVFFAFFPFGATRP